MKINVDILKFKYSVVIEHKFNKLNCKRSMKVFYKTLRRLYQR